MPAVGFPLIDNPGIAAALLAAALMNLTAVTGLANPELGHPSTAAETAAAPVTAVTAALVPGHGALWGSWVAPVNGQSDAQAVAAFESKVKRRLDIVHQYHAFD